jgi:hypothetical protein
MVTFAQQGQRGVEATTIQCVQYAILPPSVNMLDVSKVVISSLIV